MFLEAGNKTIAVCVICIVAIVLWADIGQANPDDLFQARVIRVVDADTIIVLNSNGAEIKVRLYGIDAPEHKRPGRWGYQYYANEADQFAQAIVPIGSDVTIKVAQKKDRYRRIVGIVYVGDADLGLALVASGSAWVDDRFCKKSDPCDQYRSASQHTQKMKYGLWQGEAIKPRDWRQLRMGLE